MKICTGVIQHPSQQDWKKKTTKKFMRLRNFYVGGIGRFRTERKREFLVLWKGYPIEEASWIPEDNITYKDQLQEELDEDNPQKVDDVE